MLSNHPDIAAQLAKAHRDDLERQARSRRLRRFARAANRSVRRAGDRAEVPTGRTPLHVDEIVATVVEDVAAPAPEPLPGPSR